MKKPEKRPDEGDVDEEIRGHLAISAKERIDRGDDPVKARRAALTEFGYVPAVRNEMRRVTWPSRKEVYATTVVVILTSAFFGIYLWSFDLALNAFVNWIFRRFGAA